MKTKEEIKEMAENRYGTDIGSIRGGNPYDLESDRKNGFVEGYTKCQEDIKKDNKFLEAIDCWKKQPHSWQTEVLRIALENKRKSGEINPSKLARILKTKNK